MAKFGLLYLNKGAWHGRQVVPKVWVEESTLPAKDAGGDQCGGNPNGKGRCLPTLGPTAT